MRVAVLPGKLPPGMHLFPPVTVPRLGAVPGGLDLGHPRHAAVAFADLTAVAVCTVPLEGAETAVILLFAAGQRRPFLVHAPKVRAADFGLAGAAHRPDNLRALIVRLAALAPHLAVDSDTLDFLRGRMLRPRGDRLGDLADAIGLILVSGDELEEVDLGASAEASPPAASPAAASPAAAPVEGPQVWVGRETGVLAVLAPGAVVLARLPEGELAAGAERLRAGADLAQVLGKNAFRIPNAAFVRVRHVRSAQAIEIEYRVRDGGSRKAAVPYGGDEAGGDELFAALRSHLASR
ncbi:MAG TPA: hypothetical protein VGG06_12910 [Thermoanaerobaculia bacterium]|jgi:hypothetical protein